MCTHRPRCPRASDPDHAAAHVVARRLEQGWSLLCNGVVLFDDGGELFPDGQSSDRSSAVSAERAAGPRHRFAAERSMRPGGSQSRRAVLAAGPGR